MLDIADLRRPVEVDYVPNEYFSSGLTMDGDFAYALRWNGIGAYAVAGYGALWRRETLGLADEEEGRRIPDIMTAIADTRHNQLHGPRNRQGRRHSYAL